MLNSSRMNKIFPGAGENGFTLLEVLIAVMILGLSVTVILQQFSVALHAGVKTQEVVLAMFHAREKLEEMKIKKEIEETSEAGSFDDGYAWQTGIVAFKYGEEHGEEDVYDRLKYETFLLKATILWGMGDRNRQVSLSTLRTVKKTKWK